MTKVTKLLKFLQLFTIFAIKNQVFQTFMMNISILLFDFIAVSSKKSTAHATRTVTMD
jgi:hypothetical protein